jgi:pullulanase
MKTLRTLAAAAMAGMLAWGPAQAAAPLPACGEDTPWQQVLQPAAQGLPQDASAHWLAPGWLLWPGVQASTGERFVLAHSASGRLALGTGQVLQGMDGRITLQAKAFPADLAAQVPWLAAGTGLALPTPALARVPGLLQQQLLLLHEDAQGRVLRATQLQLPGVLDAVYASSAARSPLGAQVGAANTRFALWAPTARGVALCLPGQAPVPMQRQARSGVWQTTLPQRAHGQAYRFLVDVHVRGVGLVRNRVTDPYAQSLTTDSLHSVALDMAASDLQPPGWANAPRPAPLAAATDQVIYELHVRDFSAHDASVPEAWRGKYLAFTHSEGAGVRHLKALAQAGLTHVHLLPVFDFATVPDNATALPLPQGGADSETQQAFVAATKERDAYNWGYDPLHFGAPEGSYATNAQDGRVRVRELRAMVQALHGMGLRVGMDVVYNHMSAAGQHEKSVLDRIVPGYYHRLNAKGEVESSTCCANTATEHAMMERLMTDTAVAWVRDYRIDAYRFDLMGHQPRPAMERLQTAVNAAAGRTVHLIGEGWNFGEVTDGKRFIQASQLSLNGSGIATFSDRARDAVRGGGAGDGGEAQVLRQGYVNGLFYAPNERVKAQPPKAQPTREDLLRAADLVRVGLAGTLQSYPLHTADGQTVPAAKVNYANQPAGYAQQPGEVVNYVENHDNQTLFDAHAFKLPRSTTPPERARVQTLASATMLFSQGVAYVHAGQELLRSKSMDRNSYDSGDAFNRLDFTAQDNAFGTGLPPKWDNAESWPLMQPLLADAARIKPQPEHITWARDSFLDLLRIRASSTLFRLRTAQEVNTRLRFHNTGPAQLPTLLVGELKGEGLEGAGFKRLVYFINVDVQPARFGSSEFINQPLRLHPVHAQGADARAREARFEAATGQFTVPARTAVVWVAD